MVSEPLVDDEWKPNPAERRVLRRSAARILATVGDATVTDALDTALSSYRRTRMGQVHRPELLHTMVLNEARARRRSSRGRCSE